MEWNEFDLMGGFFGVGSIIDQLLMIRTGVFGGLFVV